MNRGADSAPLVRRTVQVPRGVSRSKSFRRWARLEAASRASTIASRMAAGRLTGRRAHEIAAQRPLGKQGD